MSKGGIIHLRADQKLGNAVRVASHFATHVAVATAVLASLVLLKVAGILIIWTGLAFTIGILGNQMSKLHQGAYHPQGNVHTFFKKAKIEKRPEPIIFRPKVKASDYLNRPVKRVIQENRPRNKKRVH